MTSLDSSSAPPRVLVVDDDPDVLASLERGLRLSGFEVATAVDGAEALRSATENRPDAIIHRFRELLGLFPERSTTSLTPLPLAGKQG